VQAGVFVQAETMPDHLGVFSSPILEFWSIKHRLIIKLITYLIYKLRDESNGSN